MKSHRHNWSDISTGMWTGQNDRTCLICGLVQHTESYASHKWIDGPPLSFEEFRRRSQWIADNFKAMG